MVLLGLARVADDEVGPEHRFGLCRADGGDALPEAVPVAPAAHPAQQRPRHVLERQVEVRDPGGQHGLDQRVGEVRRVEVEQPHPVHPLGDLRHQRHDRPLPHALVPTERRQVLGHQHDLACVQRLHLGEDRLDRPAALRTPEAREVGSRSASQRDRHAEAGHPVDLRERGVQLVAVALRHAARDDQAGAVAAFVGERQHGVDRLPAGLVDEGAGVDDDQVGVARLADR